VTRRLAALLALLFASGWALPSAADTPEVPRVALVPLDDRPANLQDVVLLGRLAGADVLTPPKTRLEHLDSEGDADGIAEWIDRLDADRLDALIVSIDMLAYGGYRASKRQDVAAQRAVTRLQALHRLRARSKTVRIFAFVALPGLAITEGGRKGGWETALLRWAELGGDAPETPQATAELKSIEAQLPSLMIDRYRAARARNLAVAKAAVAALDASDVDALVLAAGDEPARGMVAHERAELAHALGPQVAERRAVFVTGVDHVATLLLGRALGGSSRSLSVAYVPTAAHAGGHPEVDEAMTVLDASVSERAGRGQPACLVYAGRDDTAAARTAAERTAAWLKAGARVSVADIGPPGSGGSVTLVEALRGERQFRRLTNYAAGAARLAVARALTSALIARDGPGTKTARELVVLHRLAVDFVYGSIARPQAIEDYLTPHQIDPAHLVADQVQRTQAYLIDEVKPLVENLIGDVSETKRMKPGPNAVRDVTDFSLKLSWNELDDVEISFGLTPE
jgi:hypothetical protein